MNSSEEFGDADIRAGAKGADVKTLQQRLREAKVYPKKGKLTGVVDDDDEKAIIRYQKRYKLPKTGIVDQRMRDGHGRPPGRAASASTRCA